MRNLSSTDTLSRDVLIQVEENASWLEIGDVFSEVHVCVWECACGWMVEKGGEMEAEELYSSHGN